MFHYCLFVCHFFRSSFFVCHFFRSSFFVCHFVFFSASFSHSVVLICCRFIPWPFPTPSASRRDSRRRLCVCLRFPACCLSSSFLLVCQIIIIILMIIFIINLSHLHYSLHQSPFCLWLSFFNSLRLLALVFVYIRPLRAISIITLRVPASL